VVLGEELLVIAVYVLYKTVAVMTDCMMYQTAISTRSMCFKSI